MTIGPRLGPLFSLAASAALLAACGDGGSATTDGAGGSTATTSPAGGSGGTGTAGNGGAGGQGGSGGTGGAGGHGGSGGAPMECATLPAGPFDPVEVLDVFSGSEDLAFDGKGHIAAKNGDEILLSDAGGQTTVVASGLPPAYGLRYQPDGSLAVAAYGAGEVLRVSPQGDVSVAATGLDVPNGLYPDFDGNVWVTEMGANRVIRLLPDDTIEVVVSGAKAAGANGVVLDAGRKMLYYTNYGQGRIRRVDMNVGADPAPIDVIQIQGAALDGLVMDACGHIYVVDQGNSDIYRVKLDAAGAAAGAEELIAELPQNVANAQFGSGAGFDPKTLYAAGNPGVVFAVAVGVGGAPVPTPP